MEWKSWKVRYRSYIGCIACFWGLLVWTVPVGAIQAAVSQENLRSWAPSALDFMEKHLGSLYGLIFGYLPVLALMALLLLLPCLLNNFALRFEARKVKSDIVRAVLWRNFLFQLATLWATVFSGTISSSFRQIVNHPACMNIILGKSIPKVSVYFTSFVIARSGLGLPLVLLPITSFIACLRLTKVEAQTCEFETEAINIAIVFVLGLMYFLVAPAILPVCMIYFGLATLVYRWKFTYVYAPQFSCVGAFWNELSAGVMIGMLLGLCSLCGLAVVYQGPKSAELWAITLLPIFTGAFQVYCMRRFAPLASSMPYQDAVRIDREQTQVCASFSEDYYKDPILKPRVANLGELQEESDELGSSSDTSSSEEA